MRWPLLLLACAECACSSPSIRGAQIARSSAEPAGRLEAEYSARGCKDARGGSAELELSVRLVEFQPGHWVLVLRRQGYDSLVISNAFEQGGEWVFQAQSDASDPLLYDVRLRAPNWQGGRLAYAREFREQRGEEDHFQAYFDAPVLVCGLERVAPAPTPP
ncbi:MAG TPA: hypothetical protein VK524_15560 [Polyangiaceae bacterium]|nr:hypothetical protein [Polyangiaceae bacterium]